MLTPTFRLPAEGFGGYSPEELAEAFLAVATERDWRLPGRGWVAPADFLRTVAAVNVYLGQPVWVTRGRMDVDSDGAEVSELFIEFAGLGEDLAKSPAPPPPKMEPTKNRHGHVLKPKPKSVKPPVSHPQVRVTAWPTQQNTDIPAGYEASVRLTHEED